MALAPRSQQAHRLLRSSRLIRFVHLTGRSSLPIGDQCGQQVPEIRIHRSALRGRPRRLALVATSSQTVLQPWSWPRGPALRLPSPSAAPCWRARGCARSAGQRSYSAECSYNYSTSHVAAAEGCSLAAVYLGQRQSVRWKCETFPGYRRLDSDSLCSSGLSARIGGAAECYIRCRSGSGDSSC